MKKILVLAISVLLLIMLAVPASAAGTVSATVSSAAVYRGDTFTVTVSVADAGSCKKGGIQVELGQSFELIGAEWLVKTPDIDYFVVELCEGGFGYENNTALSGKLVKLTFKVKSNAAFGSDSITIKIRLDGTDLSAKTVKTTITCNHKYGAWASAGTDKHSRKCSVCGTVDTKAHTYDNPCDVDCNDCGATRVTEHAFVEEWTCNENGHWHVCSHCGAESTLEEHVPGAPAGEYTDQVCTVCQEILVPALGHQHSYDNTYKTDSTFHWTKCLGCGEETEKVAHVYENDCDEICDVCEHQRGVVHKTSEKWHCDDGKHWKTCADCGLRLEENAHVWDGGTVTLEPTGTSNGKMLYRCGLCQTTKTEEIPALQLGEALPWWLWMLIGAACGATIVLVIQLIVGLSKSSHKGKYSG